MMKIVSNFECKEYVKVPWLPRFSAGENLH